MPSVLWYLVVFHFSWARTDCGCYLVKHLLPRAYRIKRRVLAFDYLLLLFGYKTPEVWASIWMRTLL